MKFLRFLFSAFYLLSICQILTAQSVQTQVSNAVLKVYDDELRQNPDNFNVLFRRAFHFYGQNQYNRALADIDRAIQLIPAKDSDLLMQAYSLRANIYLMTDKPQLALPDLDKASQLDPSSYTLLYQKANTEFLLGNYTAAKEDYKALQRRHNRSLEALIGQARVAVKENNLGLANELVDEAVAMYPSSSEAYTRRASVRRMLGNNVGAVDDLVMAIAVDKDNKKALRDIVEMSHVDYNAVITSLSSAINQAPDNGLYT
ncbi:MAG: tetratricopeptide repeat protein, partial [Muribaculaceae bacterium]|nr:tetratricopeptide repeat protein [Muribaculaceae bacterium]